MHGDLEVRMPGPRAHLRGTLATLDRLGPVPPALRAFLDRPEALPADVHARDATLKYDLYVNPHAGGVAWGVATSDRYDPDFWTAASECVRALGPYRLDVAERVRGELPGSTVLAVGFDAPGRPPRLKVYVQEASWQAGVGRTADVERALGVRLPPWVGDRVVGVVTIELHADGRTSAKAYLGGPTPRAAAHGAPDDVQALADALAAVSKGGWYYLTIRLGDVAAGRSDVPRFAMNRIVDHVRAGFTHGAAGLEPLWTEVGDLFALAGRREDLARLRRDLYVPGVRLVPTATAIEDAGRSVDVYFGAWQTS